ncbi:phage major capsid protein [Rhizobium leguminosarum]|uniref:phage major capsid family protein n=1 Tax=Rhizobium leguminosarum TaxID=384 RepID=UPI00102F6E7E|nr:phage major capsid protein [Rhizobium leguminosarum]TAX48813.1 phage major capsid protein [Rhizobium leguminosarum]TAZ59818.1 phage major capsid protein [Rhizobium leguminosarum]WSH72413.1 phage major capsid protein [Rhizobium leguminosarum]
MQNHQAEFAGTIQSLVRALAICERTGEPLSDVADRLRMPAPAQRILKAAVGAGSLGDPAWAGQLADMAAASSAFLQGLGGRSAFASLLDLGVLTRAPLRSSVGAVSEGVVGAVNAEGQARPVSRMSLSGDVLAAQQADAIIVLSREVVENSSAASQAFVSRQLRRSVAQALDVGFFDRLITSSTPTFAATANHVSDLKQMLDAVNGGAGRLAWIAAPDVANSISLLNDGRGGASPEGLSEFLGLPFAVSPGIAAGTLILLDGDRVLADIESLGVDTSRFTTLQMNDEPTMDATTPTATAVVSLWQTNSVAIKISALFGAVAGTDDAIAVLTDVAWPPIVSG